MSGCDTNLVTRDDLYKAKRQTQFIADVGTGGPTETVTNPDTGVVVPTLQKVLAEMGFTHAAAWNTNPLVTEALQVIPYNNQLFLPNTLPYQVDSAAHPDPNALVPSELRDVSKFITEQYIESNVYDRLLFSFNTLTGLVDVSNTKINPELINANTYLEVKTAAYDSNTLLTTTPSGGCYYLISSLVTARNQRGDQSWVPDGHIDHYLFGATEYVAVAVIDNEITATQAGAVPTSSVDSYDALNAAIQYCKTYRKEFVIDGFFGTSQTLLVPSAARWRGKGHGNSGFFNLGADGSFCLAGEGGEQSGTYDVNLSDFRVSSLAIADYKKNLFDMTGFRYGSLDNVKMILGGIAARITASWGMTFTNCYFNAGGNVNIGAIPTGTTGIDSPSGLVESVMNLSTFIGCEINGNEIGVNAVSLGRNVMFEGCGFEANKIAFKAAGSGQSLGITIKNSYWEGNVEDCVLIDNSAADRSDQIKLIDNYIAPSSTAKSLFVRMQGVSNSAMAIDIIDNLIEVFNGRGPANNFILYTPNGTGLTRINYQHHKPPIISQPGYTVKHWQKDNVNYATMSSNLPVLLEYVGGFAGTSIFDALKVYFDNGRVNVVGNAINAGNSSTSQLNVAKIPLSLIPLISGTTIQGQQFPGVTSQPNVYCTVTLVGEYLMAAFPTPDARMEISGSWMSKSGAYLGFVS